MNSLGPARVNNNHVSNLNNRLTDAKAELDSLKENAAFQNALFLLLEAPISDKLVVGFLLGKNSLEDCLGNETESPTTRLLLAAYPALFELRSGWFGAPDSHHLSEATVTTLATIFKSGMFEPVEKTQAKLRVMKNSIVDSEWKCLNLSEADLSGADLTQADLRSASLCRADLCNAILRGAKLTGADLTGAKLTEAKLTEANLTGAVLLGAVLINANLTRADLYCANLTQANLTGADLTGADLTGANLTGATLTAKLTGANLTGAKLSGANLTGAKLSGVKLTQDHLTRADLTRADLRGAKSDCRRIIAMIEKQNASEKYGLLSEIVKAENLGGATFPKELRQLIGRNLI